jgi:WD40 repeat protein
VVGVSNPADPKLKATSSRDAVRQASSAFAWFSQTAGWDRNHLLLLTDSGGSDDPGTVRSPAPNITPLKKNLDWAFREWLKRRAQPDDVIVFYFAGQARSVAPKSGSFFPENYLLPSDALSDNLSNSGWSLDKALDEYAKQAKYQIVCWLATSLGTEPLTAGGAVQSIDSVELSRHWLRHLARWPSVTVWLASDSTPTTAPAELAVTFTQAVLAGFGTGDHRQNLSGCLRTLHQTANLKGFRSIGGVPPHLNLWADQLGRPDKSPQPEMVLQVGHADRILDIVSTPDGRLLMTASQDSTIRVWSPAQNALLRILTDHSVGATALGLSENGRWLVSGGGRGEVLVHDLSQSFTRKSIARQPHQGDSRVSQVAMLPDGAHFVTVDSLARAYIWNMNPSSLTTQPWMKDVDCRQVRFGGRGEDGVVAALCGDGAVRLFDSAGAGNTLIAAPASEPVAISVSPDGRLLALGCDDGQIVVKELKGGRQTERKGVDGPVRQLAFASSSRLVVGHDDGVRWFVVNAAASLGEGTDLVSGGGIEKLAVSHDGTLLGACAKDTGALQVWRFDGDKTATPVLVERKAGASAMVFSSDGRALITGTKLGSVKTWPVGERNQPAPREYAAHRGKIKQLATSPSRAFLLMLNDLNQAQLWDLGQRTCRLLPDKWSGGVFLSDDTLILADRPDQERPGRIVRIDRNTFDVNPSFFARSSKAFQIDPEIRFEAVTLSADGSRVAASANPLQQPLVCVWETRSGRLTHWITAASLRDPVSALCFTSDARQLVSAGDSPEARLWELSRGDGSVESPAVTFEEASARNITCVQVQPGLNRQMVTGHSDGRLLLWSWADGKSRQTLPLQTLAERFFTLAVHAITFTPDGRYLAAAGDGPRIWLAEMGEQVRQLRDWGGPLHHLEQINALSIWAGPTPAVRANEKLAANPQFVGARRPPVLISGSDDTTVKFWDLEKRTLLGTFRAATTTADPAHPAKPTAVRSLEWVLYTPDGHFDASQGGRELVRFRQADNAHPMEQFDSTKLYTFELSELLRSGRIAEATQLEPPPPVAIDPPLRTNPAQPETQLTISLGSPDLKDVRLYHNGIPVPSGQEDAQPPLPDQFTVPVRLLPGTNRFYAMASRDGTFDCRSSEVEIPFDGAVEPGRLHIIALGVGNYDREKLQFAKRDAERLSEVLHDKGLTRDQERGRSILLTDNQVNARKIADAFSEMSREVRERPQDTVVLFLAGHTGVFDNERFCLLLPKYPFPADAPLMVAVRGTNPPIAKGAKVAPEDFIAYSTLAANLMRLDALNRLVIVDACQAETILVDPQVAAIQKWMEIGSRKARTSYLMAARRGEPALEIEPLGHGLFTYTLLRGMGEVLPADEPQIVADLHLRPDADYDRDGIISTSELDAYVKETMPSIAAIFPEMVARGSVTNNASPAAARPNVNQSLRLQTSPASFPLIRLK